MERALGVCWLRCLERALGACRLPCEGRCLRPCRAPAGLVARMERGWCSWGWLEEMPCARAWARPRAWPRSLPWTLLGIREPLAEPEAT